MAAVHKVEHLGSVRVPVGAPAADRSRAHLTLVAPTNRRRLTGAAALFATFVCLALLAVAGRVHMASQQIELDRINNDVRRARTYFDSLRSDRARLLSPENLIAEATRMGMAPGMSNRIVTVTPELATFVAARVGTIDPDIGSRVESPLDEFGRIKSAVAGAK